MASKADQTGEQQGRQDGLSDRRDGLPGRRDGLSDRMGGQAE